MKHRENISSLSKLSAEEIDEFVRNYLDSIVPELRDYRVFKKNYCYDCGSVISTNKHFCNQECRDKYFKKFESERKGFNELKKQTHHRKINNLPHHQTSPLDIFFKFGKITGPPKLQYFLNLLEYFKEMDRANVRTYLQWLKDINQESNLPEDTFE